MIWGLKRALLVVGCVCGFVSGGAFGQAPINSNIALQPSKGGVIVREQFRFSSADFSTPMGELEIETAVSVTTLVYGLSDRWTLIAQTPFVLSRRIENQATGTTDTDSGFGDTRLLSKFRVYRDDFGVNSTARFDLIGGVELPTGGDGFGSESLDVLVGGVYSYIKDRHGVSVDSVWKFNTGGDADVLKYDAAYSYRLFPARYTNDEPTAWFGGIELNGLYETNGDAELFVSPGISYVTERWILEATVQVPAWQSLDQRAERDFVVGIGIRFQF